MKQITYKDLEPRRHELGLTLPQMARKCGIEEWRFLEMLERGEIETTSSAIMVCVAKGYGFERAQCVKMIVHWSPNWPRARFMRGAKTEGIETKKKKYTPKGEHVQYWPGAIAEMMERKWIAFEQLHKMTKSAMRVGTLSDIVTGRKETVTMVQMRALCKALRCKPWEISPDYKQGEELEKVEGGVA